MRLEEEQEQAEKEAQAKETETGDAAMGAGTVTAALGSSGVPTVPTIHEQPAEESQAEVEKTDSGTRYVGRPSAEASGPDEPVSVGKAEDEAVSPAGSPPKGNSKVKSWFKSRFRSSSKSQDDQDEKSGFVGGAALTGAGKPEDDKDASRAESDGESNSMRDVALAGRDKSQESEDMYGGDNRSVSPVDETSSLGVARVAVGGKAVSFSLPSAYSDDEGDTDSKRGRGESRPEVKEKLPTMTETSPDPVVDVKTDEAEQGVEEAQQNTHDESQYLSPEEAQHAYEQETRAAPAPIGDGEGSGLQAASPRGSKERSRFKEEL